MQEWYHGWWRPKIMTKKQIKEMLNNMKKAEVVSKKSNQYHEKETVEAENILKNLDKDDKTFNK